MPNTFKRGIHSNDCKELSKKANIENMPAPSKVYICLNQHIGKPAVPVVSVNDTVKMGQLIAKADGVISSNIFSSVSGQVVAIENRATASGAATHIVIQNDTLDTPYVFERLSNPTSEAIIARIADAGIVGMGGAGFPTAVKLKPKKPVDTFIINAAECEPYITCDYRIMLDLTLPFVNGVLLLAKALNIPKAIIGIETNKTDAIEHLQLYIDRNNLSEKLAIVSLKPKYPQGAEKQLIYAVTKRKVPTGGLPMDVGCIVSNVATALATYLAVSEGTPLYNRVVTVSGKGIARPSNLWVRNGTLYSDIIAYLGGYGDAATTRIINGGPMMGASVSNTDISATKTTSCILLLSESEVNNSKATACINCSKCAKVCPMQLMPMYIDSYSLLGDYTNAVKYGAKNCIECGCCSFICPAKRPLVQSIKLAKKAASK